jgi:flagellar hook-associated protein 3 FlgL
MTRVGDNQVRRVLLDNILTNKEDVLRYSDQVSTGIKVKMPGDSSSSGLIGQYQETLRRVESYSQQIGTIESSLAFQDTVLGEVQDVMTRVKELATQAASENTTVQGRAMLAREVMELRDHIVQLANSQYQGKYLYGGADDDDPPYDAATYTVPTSGLESQRYVYDAESGTDINRLVNITDNLSIAVNSSGSGVFTNAIQAVERLGRAMAGYTTLPASGAPDGTGAAYSFPADLARQSDDIANTIDLVNYSLSNDISIERASLAGRLRRLETAKSILSGLKDDGDQILTQLQKADITEAASSLSQAQTALEASYSVSARVLNLSILDFL